ncbi:hypothetical protein AACH06_10575 [Ideonella sp. DXS29W]|uniref:Uncharacterized protein n=1 Tax=Ideonella lacteola TaxID=2984193 RepID=A0ABU9BNB4_9BURK
MSALSTLGLGLVALALAAEWWGLHLRRRALRRASEGEAEDASDEWQV